ncbi:MAG: hypothetical protein CM1200mP26_12690 [Acidimicrobiales bacterium]|nr:MAG: hypothetical protein CM1200mP26_12690 [Acidimicrobiales bacterium]
MGVGDHGLEKALFGGFDPATHLSNHPVHELLGVDLSAYGDPGAKQAVGNWTNVDPGNEVPFVVELDDLLRLHHIVLSRRVTTILEFGVGKSTTVLAHALAINEERDAGVVAADMRRSNPFELHSVDNDTSWIETASQALPEFLRDRCHLHHCPLEIGEFAGRLCTYYRNLPNLAPDLIYLDGPDQFSAEGDLRGLSTAHPDRMPMAADILVFEHFLTPGTLIVVDGRTANARFLATNLQRRWSYWHAVEFDQHFFELVETPLGPYNARQIEHCLGDDFSVRSNI